MIVPEIEKAATSAAKTLLDHIKAARADEMAYAKKHFLDKGIPYLLRNQPIMGGDAFYRILMPDGSLLMKRRRGPKGYFEEPVAYFRRKAAFRRWLKEKEIALSKRPLPIQETE